MHNAHRTHRHGGEVSRLSLPLDFSCAAMEPGTDEAITQRMPNQENCNEMELEKYNYISLINFDAHNTFGLPGVWSNTFFSPFVIKKLEIA